MVSNFRIRCICSAHSRCVSRHELVVEDVFGAGDKVVLRWSATMTHRGDHLGMPATGKPVRITGITIARIANNQIIEGWDNWDQSGMLKQIGAYVAPQATWLKSA